jgi:uncharacterized membrane protein
MTKGRLEAFSDGVIAILITIMVLELKIPHGADWKALSSILPIFLAYVLSFVLLGIYWNNHHHMLHATRQINGTILWANLHLLFWLSLVPFTTAWMGENHFAELPVATYGCVLLLSAIAYTILQNRLIATGSMTPAVVTALQRDLKGKISAALYLSAIPLAFVHPGISGAIYVCVALIWLVPDSRIESRLSEIEHDAAVHHDSRAHHEATDGHDSAAARGQGNR